MGKIHGILKIKVGNNIDIDVSIDGINWTTIDTSTNTAGEVRTIPDYTAAMFVRANVNTNTGLNNGKQFTAYIIATATVENPSVIDASKKSTSITLSLT